jgi:hypothetical protein
MAGLEHPELPGSQARLGFKDCAGARARRGIQAWVVPGEWMWSESREFRAYLAPRAKSDALGLRDQKALRFFVSACFVSSFCGACGLKLILPFTGSSRQHRHSRQMGVSGHAGHLWRGTGPNLGSTNVELWRA